MYKYDEVWLAERGLGPEDVKTNGWVWVEDRDNGSKWVKVPTLD